MFLIVVVGLAISGGGLLTKTVKLFYNAKLLGLADPDESV
jgi:hypothetical protein